MKKIFTLLFVSCMFGSMYGQIAPDFTFTDIKGDTLTMSEALKDGKVVMVDFFFVDCPPCIQWAPEIDQLIEDYQGTTFEIWAMSDRDSDATIANSMFHSTHDNHKVGGPDGGALDVINLFASQFNFTGFPTFAVICSDSTITWDIWPLSTGINEIRSRLTESCGVVALSTSVPNIESLLAAAAYPNPASRDVTIDFNLTTSTKMNIDLFNSLGQKVQSITSQEYTSGRQIEQINVSNLSDGMYFVRMQTEDGIHNMELVVNHN